MLRTVNDVDGKYPLGRPRWVFTASVVTFFLERSLKSCKLKFFQSFWIIWTFLDVPTEAVDIPQSQGLSDTVCLGWMLLKKRYYRKLFKFKKKIGIKQAFFINEICSSRVWAKFLFLYESIYAMAIDKFLYLFIFFPWNRHAHSSPGGKW